MRPAVADDVVQGQRAARAPRPPAAGARAQQRPARQVERAQRLRPCPARRTAASRSASSAVPDRSTRRGRTGGRRVDDLHGLAVHRGEARCAAPRGGPRSRSARARSASASRAPRSRRATGMLYAVRRGLQPVDEPQPLLRERERQRAHRGGRATSAGPATRRRPRAGPRPRARPGRPPWAPRRARAAGSSTPERLAHPRDQARGQQRVPAQREEVVRRAHPAPPSAPRPKMPASTSSACVRGATYSCRAAASGAGSAARSSLPFAVSGSVSIATNAVGTMYSGSRARSASRSVRRDDVPARRAGRRTPPAAARPPPSWRDDDGGLARPSGCASSAASISPSSMRKPRIFTCWSSGPGTPARRPRASAPRSPVRYSRAPASAENGSGTKRSAVSSGRPQVAARHAARRPRTARPGRRGDGLRRRGPARTAAGPRAARR